MFHPDPTSAGQHLTDLARGLARRGADVTVLTGRRGYYAPHPLYPARETWEGIRIIRVWPFYWGARHRWLRILDGLLTNLVFCLHLARCGRFDRIVVMTAPPLVAAVALFFSRRKRIPLIYWVMDLNPEQALRLGWLSASSFPARMLEKISRWTFRNASQVIVLDRFMKDRVLAKAPGHPGIHIVPPWPHEEDLGAVPRDQNPFIQKYGLREKFVVMYSGNHSICHPLDTVLEGALRLKDDPGAVFVFIGGGEGVRKVRTFRERHPEVNIIRLPHQKREELKYSLSAADVHVAVMGEAFEGIVHPCKMYGIMVTGCPWIFVGPAGSPAGELIASEKVGIHVNHGDVEGFVRALGGVRAMSPAQRRDLVRRQRDLMSKFSQEKLLNQTVEVVRKGGA